MQRTAWNRRLLASTRGRILALLRDEHRTVNDLAAALQLTGNAVRAHLLSLERDGLAQQYGIRRGTRRPHLTYGLSAEAEHVFPKAYGPLLNQFVAVLARRSPPAVLRAFMRQVGRTFAKQHLEPASTRSRRDRIKAALHLLKELGGAARFDDSGGRQRIHGRNGCPLAAVTASHPEACLIIESLLSETLGVPVKKCCNYAETPRCCFEIEGRLRGKLDLHA